MNHALRGILRSEFQPGRRFLTEREISARFGVSRATANKALGNLVSENLVEFRKGVGTFVKGSALHHDLQQLVSFTTKAAAVGKTPHTRVMRFRTLSAPDAPPCIATALCLGQDDSIFYMERLRLADHLPVIFERRYVSARLCPNLQRHDVAGSIYELWTQQFSLQIGSVDQTIRAVNLGAEDAGRLQIQEGAAALEIRCTGRLEDGRPLWHEQTLYRGDAYEFYSQLNGSSARPAIGRLLP